MTPRPTLTNDVLSEMMPGLTSTTLVSLRRSDLRRGGSPEATRAARRLDPPGAGADHEDAEWFDESVLAASEDVPTRRIEKAAKNPAEADTEILFKSAAAGLDARERPSEEKRRKPTDSFTLSPEFAQRVFESSTIEIIDPATGDHLSFVRGLLHRDESERVVKIQCYLPRGTYLAAMGTKLEFRMGSERWRVRDGFYVTPRGGRGDEWMYLGYVS